MNQEHLAIIIDKYKGKQGGLIAMLEEAQNLDGYLSEETLRRLAEGTGHALVDVYGVATFYRAFSLKPRGKHLVLVCLGTACHVRGAPRIAAEFEHHLQIKAGETTADMEFTIETVNCLGACALGPTVVVDGQYFSHVSPKKVKEIIAKTRQGLEQVDVKNDPRIFPVLVSCSLCRQSLMDPDYPIDGRPSVKFDISFDSRHGWLRLSSLYGSYTSTAEHDIPAQTVVDFLCPHCHEQLADPALCAVCEAPMALMDVQGGGKLQICSRKGCQHHILDLNGTQAEVMQNYREKQPLTGKGR